MRNTFYNTNITIVYYFNLQFSVIINNMHSVYIKLFITKFSVLWVFRWIINQRESANDDDGHFLTG